jgi:hypothetical protein
MAQMQIGLAAIYRKYYTRIDPRTTDASMQVDDGITSAGPIVFYLEMQLIYRVITASLNFMTHMIREIPKHGDKYVPLTADVR